MLLIKLAYRNLIGAGLRTWLNVAVLSLAFVAIIWTRGLMEGMQKQAMTALIDTEYGGGQFWHQAYDPYDPLRIEDAHAPLPPTLQHLVQRGEATPILIASGAIFPEGRIQTVRLKGIAPEQHLLNLPSQFLANAAQDGIPAMIGSRMAKQTKLAVGDTVTVRWRDIHGTFDATDLQIVQIMTTSVQSVDSGQVWLPLRALREMLHASDTEATIVIVEQRLASVPAGDAVWQFHAPSDLLKDVQAMIDTKNISNSILFALLLAMALLAIFDTQVLSIFRRRKEMGTLMALGMPRLEIIGLFTLEGALHGILALLVGAVYGIPLLWYSAASGIALPKEAMDSTGFAISDTLYPHYGAGLVLGTTLLVLIAVTVVSFLPTRRIVNLKPTEALKGKLT